MVGTVAYMAPERFGEADAPLTPAADVFAWGGVVAYAGTGRTPFGSESAPSTAVRILTQPPDLSGLTGPLRDLVASALAKDPADRPSARELLDLLVAGPSRPAAAALAGQPELDAAAKQAQWVTGLMPAATPAGLVGYDEDSIVTQPVSGMPEPVEPAPVPLRRRLFLPMALAMLLLAVVAGAGMVMFKGTVRQPVDAAAPSPPAFAGLTDDLSRSRYWLAKTEPDGSSCTFDRALVVRIQARGLYKCRGPQDQLPRDLDVAVGVRLLTKDTCASIWFRFQHPRGYQLRVCPRTIYVGTHQSSAVRVISTFPLLDPIKVGTAATRIGLRITGAAVEITRNGAPVGTAPLADAEITGSRVLLGVYTDEDAPKTGSFAVAYDHIEING